MTEAGVPQMPSGDPTQRTIDALHREIETVHDWAELQLLSAAAISDERIESQRRVDEIREAHRIELKADNRQTVETAMVAAEKAVQAALAAAEKARDQQTIASQLATSLAQEGSKEQMKQQAETFSTAISGLNVGFSDVKSMLGELRTEKRVGQESTTEHRANNTQMIATASVVAALCGSALGAILLKVLGG